MCKLVETEGSQPPLQHIASSEVGRVPRGKSCEVGASVRYCHGHVCGGGGDPEADRGLRQCRSRHLTSYNRTGSFNPSRRYVGLVGSLSMIPVILRKSEMRLLLGRLACQGLRPERGASTPASASWNSPTHVNSTTQRSAS